MKLKTTLAALSATLAFGAYATEFRSSDVHNSDDYPTVAAVKHMSDLLKQASGGKHSIKVFNKGALGSEKETIDQTKIVDLGPLTGTEGMQDYKVPTEMTAGAMGYHTVALWDTAMKHVIAAAPLAVK